MKTPGILLLGAAVFLAGPALGAQQSTPLRAGQGGQGLQPELGTCEVIARVLHGGPPVQLSDAPLTLAITFNANVTAGQQAVIQQAAADWLARIEGAGWLANPFPISFANGPLAGSRLAQAQPSWDTDGVLLSSAITIDNDGSSSFFVDPTPGQDEEFDATGTCVGATCGASDLLTVMRHELGHALGWTGLFAGTTGAPPNPKVATLMSGVIFDPTRFNIPTDPALTSHSDPAFFPGDLMNPGLAAGVRLDISDYPDLSMIARAYDHDVVLRFIAVGGSVSQAGSADLPYSSFRKANKLAPPGAVLVVIPGTYSEPTPLILDRAHRYILARGGSAHIE